MSRTVVVSQPMFLPWIGLFEQVQLSKIFFHYDDVQLPQGRNFMSRVQIKTASGIAWLTIPLNRRGSGKRINQVFISAEEDWRARHLKTIRHAYARAPHFGLMFGLVERIYEYSTDSLAEFNMHGIEKIAHWLGLTPEFQRSSLSGIRGMGSQRLVDLCASVGAETYVTGLGALNYLEHELFEERAIAVRYMAYKLTVYPQQHGDFTPYVSIIDAIANVGDRTRELVSSPSVHWKKMTKQEG